MESERNAFDTSSTTSNMNYSDPLVIGLGCFAVGLVIGSGRWNWLGKELGRLSQSLGSLALSYMTQSLQQHNPNLFTERSNITHH
jgi:hypothetical protein